MALPWWWADVSGVMTSRGVPTRAWLPIVLSESGGYAGATNINPRTGDESYGLFQENRAGGMGAGHDPLALYTPSTAAEIAANNLTPAYQRYGLNWWQLSRAGWPGATVAANDPRVTIKQQIAATIGNSATDEEAWARTVRWHSADADARPSGVPGSGTVDPGDPTDPNAPGIGASIVGAASSAGEAVVGGILQGVAGAAIDHAASWGFVGVGALCIVAGVLSLSLSAAASKPGKAAISIASVASGGTAAVAARTVAAATPETPPAAPERRVAGQGATRPT